MKAFVTGSTGLLGSNLVNLLLEQGWQVKALARSREKAQKLLGNSGANIIVGDMEDVSAFAAELEGCDALFHVAAYFREYYGSGSDHWTPLKKINVDGTIQLLTEAEKRGVKKTIYVSSSGTLGRTANGQPSDESTPPDEYTKKNLYFWSKVESERALAEWRKTHSMPVVTILPTVMIGPQDAAPTAIGQAVVNLLNNKQPAVPPGGFEFVDVRDVAQAMINAVEKGKDGERYILSEGYHTVAEMAQAVEKASGVPAPRLHLPYPVALAVAWLSEVDGRITNNPPLVTVEAVQTMNRLGMVTASKAKRELGATFRPFEASICDEVLWYQQNGYAINQTR
jgi:dihydroflavonol-4-reductase